jgi:hypothetical protein
MAPGPNDGNTPANGGRTCRTSSARNRCARNTPAMPALFRFSVSGLFRGFYCLRRAIFTSVHADRTSTNFW